MNLTLRPATPADIPVCARLAHAAFSPSPLIQAIAPASEAHALAFWAAVAQSGIDEPNSHLIVVEDATSHVPPVVVGFAKWVYVSAGAPAPGILAAGAGGEGEKAGLRETVGDAELAGRFFSEQNVRHEKYMAGRRHWYLELICTRHEVKGLGAGRRLVQWGVERVDGDGCEAYLEASPEGRGLFERFGFVVVERLGYLDGQYVECSMVRGVKGQ